MPRHNFLADIQGGNSNERYHLTADEYNALTAGIGNALYSLEEFVTTQTSGINDQIYVLSDIPDGYEVDYVVYAKTPCATIPTPDWQYTTATKELEFLFTVEETGLPVKVFYKKSA